MDEKKKKSLNLILYIAGLVMIGLMYGNSNNDPTPYINRLFHSSNGLESRVYWENIIVVIVIFILLQAIYDVTQWTPLRGFFMKWFAAIIFVVLVDHMNVYVTKTYKSVQPGLNSIYLERDEMALEVEDGIISNGYFVIENCSQKPRSFKVEVTYLSYNDEGEDEERKLDSGEEYLVEGHEREKVDFSGLKVQEERSHGMKSFKVRLYDENESVEFIE